MIFRNALRGCHKIPIIEKSSSYKALQRLKLYVHFMYFIPPFLLLLFLPPSPAADVDKQKKDN